MSKIIAWLILIFIVLLALRMVSLRNARRRRRAATHAAWPAAEPMVRCQRCGIFLPQSEARSIDGGHVCSSGNCAKS
jgi:hypothetical protein